MTAQMAISVDPTNWGLFTLIGCVAGFSAGLLGIGGGFIVVPTLLAILPAFGITGPDTIKIAAATSLALLIPTSIASARAHASHGGFDMRLFTLLTPAMATGAILATTFAAVVDASVIRVLFVAVACLFALHLLKTAKQTPKPEPAAELPIITLTIQTLIGGIIAGLLGIGVAFFMVPMLSRFMPVKKAIGTAAALALPLALAGIGGHLLSQTPPSCATNCQGYVFLPGVFAIGLTSVLMAPIGASVTQILPVKTLRIMFAFILLAVAAEIGLKTFSITILTDHAKQLIAEYLVNPVYSQPSPSAALPDFLMRNQQREKSAQQHKPPSIP